MRKNLRQISGIILLVLFLVGMGWLGLGKAEGQEYTSGHPRIWFTREDIPKLRCRVGISSYENILGETFGSHQAPFNKMKSWADQSIANNNIPNKDYDYLRYIRVFSLLYVLTGDSKYSDVVIQNYLPTGGIQMRYGEEIEARAIGYDWIYDELVKHPSLKTDLENMFLYSSWGETHNWIYGDWNGHLTHDNLPAWFYAYMAVAGENISDTTYNGNTVLASEYGENFMRAQSEEYLYNHLLPAYNQTTGQNGGFFMSPGTYTASLLERWSGMLKAWETATGENLFLTSTTLKKLGEYYLHIRRPHDNRKIRFADDEIGGQYNWQDWMTLMITASEYNDGYAQWIVNNINPPGSLMPYAFQQAFHILFYDPTIIPKDPSLLPLSFYADGIGLVTMRSGWDIDDVLFAFKSGDYYSGHMHYDTNSFQITKNGALAIDSGAYDTACFSEHHFEYYMRSIAHNSVSVYDPNEVWDWGSWSYGVAQANDGGQKALYGPSRGTKSREPLSYGDVTEGSLWDTGDISKYEHNPIDGYTYTVGDGTAAYSSSKVTNFTRQAVYLRPDYFVIFDRVSATDPSFTKKWLLHTMDNPTIQGTLVSSSLNSYGGGNAIYQNVEWFSTTDQPKTYTSPSGTKYNHKGGNGKLFVKTIYPEDALITKVGGPDSSGNKLNANSHEFEVEGTQYFHSYIARYPPNEAGEWRIEVQPELAQTDDIFLHVLSPTDTNTTSMPQTTRINSTTNNMVGTQIADPSGPRVVMFSRTETKDTGGLAELITYTVSGTGTSKHLIVDLKPNTQFTITNTNLDTGQKVSEETKVSSTQGTLYFETTLGSNHKINITPTGVLVIRGDVNGDGLVNVVDVQLAVNQFLGVLPQTQEADLNGDGVVNVIDVHLLVNIILSN